MLHLVGLGLGSFEDVTLRGLKAIEASEILYLESYTSIQPGLDRDSLNAKYPTKIVVEADRDFVELGCDEMLENALTKEVSFLVVGDPFGATTHSDLYLRAIQKNVKIDVVHNASIMIAVGCTGLQLYRFGQTVSVPFFDGNWKPFSFMEKIAENKKVNLHTLVLLDIKVKEQTVENMCKGLKIYEPPRFMTINQAIDQIFQYEGDENPCTRETRAIGVARAGQADQKVVAGTLEELSTVDFGRELHSLIICADELHEIEQSFYKMLHC